MSQVIILFLEPEKTRIPVNVCPGPENRIPANLLPGPESGPVPGPVEALFHASFNHPGN